jgi:Spy/CpxP family protein refolding chaperone
MKKFKIALAATALLSVAAPFAAQAQSTYDDTSAPSCSRPWHSTTHN